MKTTQITITKLGGRRECIALVKSASDIPEVLRNTIHVEDGKMVFINTEGKEEVEFNNFICWEKSDKVPTGYNCWCKGNGFETIDIIGGEYFEKSKPVTAQYINFDSDAPEFMAGADIARGDDGSVVLHAEWGDMEAKPGQEYMYLAYSDGTYALLDLQSESAKQYYIADEKGAATEVTLLQWLK